MDKRSKSVNSYTKIEKVLGDLLLDIKAKVKRQTEAESNNLDEQITAENLFPGMDHSQSYGVIEIDIDGKIVYANNPAHEMFGFKKSEMTGQSIFERSGITSKQRVLNSALSQLSKMPESLESYRVMVELEGKRTDIKVEWAFRRNHESKIIGFICLLTDVNSPEDKSTNLAVSEFQLTEFAELTRDLVWALDPSGRLTYLNSNWQAVLGYERSEMLGRPLAVFEVPVEKSRIPDWNDRTMKNELLKFEAVLISRTGDSVNLTFRATTPASTNGGILGIAYMSSRENDIEQESVNSDSAIRTEFYSNKRLEKNMNNVVIPINKYSETSVVQPRSDPDSFHSSLMDRYPSIREEKVHKILVVDDQDDITFLWTRYLESRGYEVTVSADGNKALEMIEADPLMFSVVITDLQMPNMQGDELARRLKDLQIGIPLILCTGCTGNLNLDDCHLNGIDKVLLKPIGLARLEEEVRELVSGSEVMTHGK